MADSANISSNVTSGSSVSSNLTSGSSVTTNVVESTSVSSNVVTGGVGPTGATGATGATPDAAVTGPVSSTDTAIARFDSTTGTILKDSSTTIADNGYIYSPGSLETAGAIISDTISEHTAAAGVTVDGMLIKDGAIPQSSVTNLTSDLNAARYLTPYHHGIAVTSVAASAGRVYLLMINIPIACTVDGINIINAATVDGTVRAGIYGPVSKTTETCAGASLIVESADTALAGINSSQIIPLASTALAKGKHYIAVTYSSGTHTYMRQSNQTQIVGWIQYYAQAFGALQATCPAVTDTGSAAPGMILRTT